MDTHSSLYLGIIVGIALLELLFQRFKFEDASERDGWLDLTFFLQSMVVVGPIIAYGMAAIQTHWLPGYANSLAGAPIWLQCAAFIVFEDLVQYWFHRAVHTFPPLWPLHMPHHSAPYMGIRMVFRNGFFYTLIFPNVWLAGLLVYLGFGEVYFYYSVLKAVVTMSAHSELRWDAWLHRQAALRPVAWLLERTISTPTTHFAHHAAVAGDGVGNYHGNYGNLFFFWDILFGTALISRRYPQRFGLPLDAAEHSPWYVMLFYPLFRAGKPAAMEAQQPDKQKSPIASRPGS